MNNKNKSLEKLPSIHGILSKKFGKRFEKTIDENDREYVGQLFYDAVQNVDRRYLLSRMTYLNNEETKRSLQKGFQDEVRIYINSNLNNETVNLEQKIESGICKKNTIEGELNRIIKAIENPYALIGDAVINGSIKYEENLRDKINIHQLRSSLFQEYNRINQNLQKIK